MPTEVVASTWSGFATVDVAASSFYQATSTTASTAPSPGEGNPSPTAPDPSWADQLSTYATALSAVAACLTPGIALLAVLYTRTAPPSAARTADAPAPAGSTNGRAR